MTEGNITSDRMQNVPDSRISSSRRSLGKTSAKRDTVSCFLVNIFSIVLIKRQSSCLLFKKKNSMNGRGTMHITAESVNTRNERYTICVLCLLLLTVISLYPCPCSPFYRHATDEDNFWYNHLNTIELPVQYRDAWSFIENMKTITTWSRWLKALDWPIRLISSASPSS